MNSRTNASLKLAEGEIVAFENTAYRILEVINFETAYCENIRSKRRLTLRINELKPIKDPSDIHFDVESASDKDWETANKRYSAIKPLIDKNYGRKDVDKRAEEVGVSYVTLYRWLELYLSVGTLDGLIPEKRGVKKGSVRILGAVEQIIKDVIKEVYLTPQRSSIEKVIIEVKRRCIEKGIDDIPHANTIRKRVSEINEYDRIAKRRGKNRADALFKATPGNLKANYPLDIVQIDHTRVDIMLVDEVYRKPTTKPWITVAIDVYSRMIVGFYLSYDAPSATSNAMCVSQAIFPKDNYLTDIDVKADWPVWGVMRKIHVDNGSDFRSKTFRKACMLHSIEIQYRPVRQPQYGGHIERLIGSIMNEVHDLPGTTFSSVHDRDNYDAEKNAVMTITELEQWFVNLFCNIYHKRIHSELKMPPEKRWEIGIFGDENTEAYGLASYPKDRKSTILNFLPMYKRTVQRYGISIDGVRYYADTLRHHINSKDPKDPKKKRKFIVRRDPRDISCVWLFDDNLNRYLDIPYADQTLPPTSLWEFQQAERKLRDEGRKSLNEKLIFEKITEMRRIVNESAKDTKKARRTQERQKHHKKNNMPSKLNNKNVKAKETPIKHYSSFKESIDKSGFGDID